MLVQPPVATVDTNFFKSHGVFSEELEHRTPRQLELELESPSRNCRLTLLRLLCKQAKERRPLRPGISSGTSPYPIVVFELRRVKRSMDLL